MAHHGKSRGFRGDLTGKDPREEGNRLWKDLEDRLSGQSEKLSDLLGKGKQKGEDLINSLLENYQDNSHLGTGQSVDIGTSRDKNSYAWQDFLNSAGLNNMTDEGFSGLAALLNGYLQNGSPTTERNDMFYQYLLQMLTTSDQRGFDLKQLQDQRNYESPTNQLARLMGAGISRDAAIQLLSGSSDANAIGAGAGSSAPGVSAPSGTSLNNTLNTANNVVQAIGNLINLGLTVPQAVSQVQMQKNMAYMSDRQRVAYDTATDAYFILSSSGLKDLNESIRSVDDAINTIGQLAKSGNSSALSFVQNGGVDKLRSTAPYSSPILHNLFKSERASGDYVDMFRAQIANTFADTDLKQSNRHLLGVQARQMEQEILNLRAQESYTRALTSLQFVQKDFITEQTKEVRLRNELEESWHTPDGIAMYGDKQLKNLYMEVSYLQSLTDSKAWEKQAKSILSNYDYLIATYELGTLYAQGKLDLIEGMKQEDKDLLMFCSAADECGLFNYLDTRIKAKQAGHISFGGSGTSLTDFDSLEFLDPERYRNEPTLFDKLNSFIDRHRKPKNH